MNALLTIRSHLRHLRVDHQSGQGLAEYALILALIALVAIAGVTALGQQLGVELGNIADAVGAAAP